jgi:hypothetical protein
MLWREAIYKMLFLGKKKYNSVVRMFKWGGAMHCVLAGSHVEMTSHSIWHTLHMGWTAYTKVGKVKTQHPTETEQVSRAIRTGLWGEDTGWQGRK